LVGNLNFSKSGGIQMGYIDPIHHNQYTQYANRLLPYHFDRFTTTKIQRGEMRTKQLYHEKNLVSAQLGKSKSYQHIGKANIEKGVYVDVHV
jgi:hypothetical protein